jgi:rRNA maturation RNase YbeY
VEIDITPVTRHAALLKRALTLVLGRGRGEVSLRLLAARPMRALNKAALGHDYTTDVLAFDHGDTPQGRLLEIVICPAFAQGEARKRGIPLEQELARYAVHGALHLKGHDDHDAAGQAKMWRAQERVLKRLFGKRYRPAL